MAWVVDFELQFGRFFPFGHYVGFEERLGTYFAKEMSAEDKSIFLGGVGTSYKNWVFEKFTQEIGVQHPRGPMALTAIKDHEWPLAYQAETPIRSLGSLIQLTHEVLIVEARVKELIERLEPSIHQFRPITLRQPNSEPFPGSYYIVVIGRFIDSFLPDATEQRLWHRVTYQTKGQRVDTGFLGLDAIGTENFAALAYSRQAIDGAHLWRERRLSGTSFYLSDMLHDAFIREKLTLPRHFRVKEV